MNHSVFTQKGQGCSSKHSTAPELYQEAWH